MRPATKRSTPRTALCLVVLLAAGLAAAFAAACGGSSGGPAPGGSTTSAARSTPAGSTSSASGAAGTPTPSTTPIGSVRVNVYFIRHVGTHEYIVCARRYAPATVAMGKLAVTALLAGPDASEKKAGFVSLVPAGTKLRSLKIAGGIATVDLNAAYESGGGTLSMTGRLAQVVYTLTQFPTVKGVAFKVNGAKVAVFGGEGIEIGTPQKRSDYEELTAPIFVDGPALGDDVSSPVRIFGTANVFEAQFTAQVLDAKGKVLVQKKVKASSGTGMRGTFSVLLSFSTSATGGKFVVFDNSAKNGSIIDKVSIPVVFAH
jgi:hypothetical protein